MILRIIPKSEAIPTHTCYLCSEVGACNPQCFLTSTPIFTSCTYRISQHSSQDADDRAGQSIERRRHLPLHQKNRCALPMPVTIGPQFQPDDPCSGTSLVKRKRPEDRVLTDRR